MIVTLAAMLLAALQPVLALATPQINLDTVFAGEPLWGRMISHVAWAPDGRSFLYDMPNQNPSEILSLMRYDVASGTSRAWLRAGTLSETPEVAGWSPDGTRVALLADDTLYVTSVNAVHLEKIANDVDDALWSPRGDAIAYAHEADLYVAGVSARRYVRRLTRGGVPGDVLHGTLDWVYPEELGIEHGFRWSPDGTKLAYLTMDERPVTNFPIVDFLTPHNSVDYERYPLPGEANPRVTLRIVDAAGGNDRSIYNAALHDEYVANFDFIPRTRSVEADILDRAQQTMRVQSWNAAGGDERVIYRQTSPTWVDVQPLPFWMPDGRSIWQLDLQNTAGVYLRERNGTLRRLTGNYRVNELYGVSRTGIVYAQAAYPTRRDRSLLAIALDGTVRSLTPAAGWSQPAPDVSLDRFVNTYSRLDDPPRVDLIDDTARTTRNLVPENLALKSALLPTRSFEVSSQYGPLDAYEVDPPSFNPESKYPVVVYVYGGPDAPTTSDRFGGLYNQLLAREGIIVFSIDGPASQVDNDDHVRLLLHNFGPGSLLGQEIGARYLATLPYVDTKRIGIWGWSFGGYETCYALTHSTLFAAGAAVAPVTDWHLYDSIYTERYMSEPPHGITLDAQTTPSVMLSLSKGPSDLQPVMLGPSNHEAAADPSVMLSSSKHEASHTLAQSNGNAYAASSVLTAAAHLNGPLLIQHGTSDDNVHMANSMQLMQQFILARESRVLFYPYPRKTHSIRGLAQQRSVFAHMLNFWKDVFEPDR